MTAEKYFYDNLKKYIGVYPDLFPESFCDDILNEYVNEDIWQAATTIDTKEEVAKLTSVRVCSELFISDPFIINKNHEVRQTIDNTVFSILHEGIKAYLKDFHLSKIVRDTGYNLLRYTPGGFYEEHFDAFMNPVKKADGTLESWSLYPRQVSVVVQLNTDFVGGGLSFFNDTYRIPINKGCAVFFPSSFMFPHQALPVIEGTRYAIVSWFS